MASYKQTKEEKVKFLMGMVFGVIVATVGFTGFAQLADHGLVKVKAATTEVLAK
jgi:hypothetical protein